MTMNWRDRIAHYREHIHPHVAGWVDGDLWRTIEAAGEIFEEDKIIGHIAEFGVHHGKFLFLIDALRNAPENSFAVSIFDDPDFKFIARDPCWDEMQRGSEDAFRDNAARFLPDRKFPVLVRDTLSLSKHELRPLKFLSIDAGHTAEHVINDLSLAQELLVPGGVVALDDWMRPYWPGVTEGVIRFMACHNRRLRPFMSFRFKLFLTTISEQAGYVKRFGDRMPDLCEVRQLLGHDYLVGEPR
jgi:SAM-dependent methyltransferase